MIGTYHLVVKAAWRKHILYWDNTVSLKITHLYPLFLDFNSRLVGFFVCLFSLNKNAQILTDIRILILFETYFIFFLLPVVTKLVNRGYQPHLEDFLLRINFNNYYKDN